MELETERLLLRPWRETDAANLYAFAREPAVGKAAGWRPHCSEAESLRVIREVFSAPDTFAIVPKSRGFPCGCINIMYGPDANVPLAPDEGEIGFWLGVPFWGQGWMSEALRAVVRYGFSRRGLSRIWCAYFAGNHGSRRVQEKCGFVFHHVLRDIVLKPTGEVQTMYVQAISRDAESAAEEQA